MPFYEYECSNCKFYVETLQKISDEPLRKCPSCKKQALKKLISAPVFRLKGDGWYETRQAVVNHINNGTHEYKSGNAKLVVVNGTNGAYVRTEANASEKDNLLNLNQCAIR